MSFINFVFVLMFLTSSSLLISSPDLTQGFIQKNESKYTTDTSQYTDDSLSIDWVEPINKKKKSDTSIAKTSTRFNFEFINELCLVVLNYFQKSKIFDFTLKFIQGLSLSPPL